MQRSRALRGVRADVCCTGVSRVSRPLARWQEMPLVHPVLSLPAPTLLLVHISLHRQDASYPCFTH